MAQRSIHAWLEEYGESHRNAVNKAIHWICVPVIYFCVVGFLASIPPQELPGIGRIPWAKAVVGAALIGFYLPRSLPLMAGMAVWSYFCLWLSKVLIDRSPWPLWAICAVLFTLAWIGQFYGHKVEGKKPSFLKDLQFLMIGPAWLMADLYRRLGISY
ncbi:MAG: DUF962 domain-containing protein [Flavobacteriales bacterium]|nr:DUF962 domain-containing protein [Flavobacteriales bacterium]MBP6699284.1 DUF962 domain-containing protein [Flavobacteriales bacterium]